MRSRFSLPLFAWLLHFFLSACGASSTQNLPPPHRPSPPYPLTVLLIYDQLASWALLLHENALDPAGAIPTAAKEGVFVERMRYEYAVTLTAPGHASLATGLPPSIHGISTNYIWDRLRRKIVSIYDDGVHPVIGRQDRFASLAPLRAITLADRLVEHGHGRARIVAIGMKDRSVLPLGGRHPALSLWFDTKLARFTSTTALHLQLPKWLDDFQAHNDWRNYAHPWFPLRNHSDLGPDDAKGEGGCGFDSTFPHELTNPGDVEAFLCMPQATQLLFELARRGVIEESLGEDEIPDLLTISIASTDYIGHAFGPESWEVRDHLIRVDRMAGDFLRWLSSRTHYALVITSDHGVAPLPERAHNHHLPSTAKRVSSVEEKAALEEALQ
ncbi:MAG: alkaline phosphatase family protein, partial [Sandaracinaceae bacterium]|nr:alkaline phosphatase family protein [Sandaracinaceae bacterium]